MVKSTLLPLLLLCAAMPCLNGCGESVAQEAAAPLPQQAETASPTSSGDASNGEESLRQEGETVVTKSTGKVIVLDAGHQQKANTGQEPIGPGASGTKMKVTGGTAGVATGIAEYQLNLTVSLALRDTLENRGYTVIMVRESNAVNLSNRERAEIATNAGADAFLRIHANGSEDVSASGAMTICPTAQNPYPVGQLYRQCRLLSDDVLACFTQATGSKKERVWETNTMSGINWCQVPVTILEMGYLSNPTEDVLLNSPDYQEKMVLGIANGIDRYFADWTG